jgi:hypothetical protein
MISSIQPISVKPWCSALLHILFDCFYIRTRRAMPSTFSCSKHLDWIVTFRYRTTDDALAVMICIRLFIVVAAYAQLMGTHTNITSRFVPTAHKACVICVRWCRLTVISDVTLIKYVGSLIACELHSIKYFFQTLASTSFSKNYPLWLFTAATQIQSQVSSCGIGACFL